MVTGTVFSIIGTFVVIGLVLLLSRSYQKHRVQKAINKSETYSSNSLPSYSSTPVLGGKKAVSRKSSRRGGFEADLDFEEYDDDFDDEVMLVASVLAASDNLDEIYYEEEAREPRSEISSFEDTIRPEPVIEASPPTYEAPSYDPPSYDRSSYGGGSSYDGGSSSYDSGGSSDSGGGSSD